MSFTATVPTTAALRDTLAASFSPVTRNEFSASRTVGSAASWAVWGDKTGDLSLFDDTDALLPRLRKDVVVIAATFAPGGTLTNSPPFRNFHAHRSAADGRLRSGLTGSPLEGAFLTNIVKDFPTMYANGLQQDIRYGDLDVERHIVEPFFAEQRALNLGPDTLYIPVGIHARELWDFLVERGDLPDDQRVFHRMVAPGGPRHRGHLVRELRNFSGPVNMPEAVELLLSQRMASA